ncbi:MAG: ribosome assembly cofactor RimP [Muribaculaceae bacterium]
MLDKSIITDIVSSAIADTDIFIVEISVSPANDVVVLLDSDAAGIDIDTCAAITRAIEDAFDRDIEDFSLEVGSAGITSPLKVHRQYLKNIGHDVEVLTCDGRKIHGVLTAVAPDGSFTVESPAKVKEPGAKRPTIVMQPTTLRTDECKSVRPEISFK